MRALNLSRDSEGFRVFTSEHCERLASEQILTFQRLILFGVEKTSHLFNGTISMIWFLIPAYIICAYVIVFIYVKVFPSEDIKANAWILLFAPLSLLAVIFIDLPGRLADYLHSLLCKILRGK